MATVNRKAVKTAESSHLNWMGGVSFDVKDPIVRLEMAAASCFFGEPQYYHRDASDKRPASALPARQHGRPLSSADRGHLRDTLDARSPEEWRGLSPSALMERAIDEALSADPERALLLAARLRNEHHIRVTPQIILVRAAHHTAFKGTGMVRQYGAQLIKRPDEVCTGLAYHLGRYGSTVPIPNSLKNAWRDAIERFDEYSLAKYRMESREVKLVDVVNLVHPKSAAANKLVRGELKMTDASWEAIISKEGSTPEAWEKALELMGHMAILRNVRNLLEKKVPMALFIDKLVKGAPRGQQLPFRYFSAYKAVEASAPAPVLDAIEECMKISLGNLPKFPGKTMALCDNSGSACGATTSSMGTMHVNEIANLTAIIAGQLADDGYIGIFGDRLTRLPVRKTSSIFDQLKIANEMGGDIGAATENGIWLFFDKAIRSKEHWDNIFVFSDMQAGHGGLYGTNPSEYREYAWKSDPSHIDVAKLVRKYRSSVNKNVNVFLVQVAGYQDTLIPDFYDRTYILGGWSEGLLRFASAMASIPTQ